MERITWARTADLLRAEAEDDVLHVRDAVRLGVPERSLYRWCGDDGPCTLLAPATVLLSNGTPTRRQLARAALVYAGPSAVLTGLDAARAHGLRRGELPPAVHILIPIRSRLQSTPTIRVERTKRPVIARTRDGLPVAPIERAVLDAVRRMRGRSDIAAILTEPVQRRMVLPDHLMAELDAGSRRGSSVPRAVLRAVMAGVRSAAEFDVHDWWSRSGLPYLIVLNVRISVQGRLLGIADALLPEIGLVLQIDSVEQHFMTPEQVEETERQHRAYRSAGLHVIGIRPSRLRLDRAGLDRDVRDAVAVAEQLPAVDIEWCHDLPRAV